MSIYISRKERNVQSRTAFPLCLCIYITNIHIKIFWRRKDWSPSLMYRNLNKLYCSSKERATFEFLTSLWWNLSLLDMTSCKMGQIPITNCKKILCPSTYVGPKTLCLYRIHNWTSPERKDGGIRPICWCYILVWLKTCWISRFILFSFTLTLYEWDGEIKIHVALL